MSMATAMRALPSQEAPAGLEPVLQTVERVRVELAAVAARALSPQERLRLRTALQQLRGSVEHTQGLLLRAERDAGHWQRAGSRSVAEWLGTVTGEGRRAALDQVRQAEAMEAMPVVASAVRDGQITPAHLEALAKVAAGAQGAARTALTSPTGQAEAVAMARRMDADVFGRAIARRVAEHDPAGPERSHARQRAARYLHLTHTPSGTFLKGRLDTLAGHRLQLALEAVTPRPGKDDERTPEQRSADGLDMLASKLLSLPETGSGKAVRPHVSLVMTEETWVALKAHQAARAAGDAVTFAERPVVPVTTEDGTPVPPSEVARALCDCELTRVVVGSDSVPLDLGRTERLYTGPQRRAVIARDRTCSWPGCDLHARWGEVHHIRWWDRDGGRTSVANGVLLCVFHHQRVHDHDLSITRHPVPPGESAPNGLAAVRYEFRRRDGTLFGPPLPQMARLPDRQQPPDGHPPEGRPRDGQPPDGQPPDGRSPNGLWPDGRSPDGER